MIPALPSRSASILGLSLSFNEGLPAVVPVVPVVDEPYVEVLAVEEPWVGTPWLVCLLSEKPVWPSVKPAG